jgi:1-acyl-sn-glycerol-3-phosphate acyltransferase
MPFLVDDEILSRVDRLEIPFNRHGIDPYGVDRVDLARFFTFLSWFYRRYFRVTVSGIDRVPAHGRAMLVGNHSGGIALDGAMVIASCFLEMEPPRLAHGMIEKFLARVPMAAQYSIKCGQITGLPEHAVELLEHERLLMVFPEGARGTAKLYGDRNTLVKFGNGFMRLALQARAPIVPFAFLGGGDAVPTVVNLVGLGRLFGAPYVPITPYLLPIPRPVQLELYYSEPMVFEGDGNEEDEVIDGYVARVKQRIATLIEQGERIRRGRDSAS